MFEYLFWRGRALRQAIGSYGIGVRMGILERKKIEKEIKGIESKLKILAKKEIEKKVNKKRV